MKVVELSGGVGGARLARGLDALPDIDLTVVVNVGDDERFHGLLVSADIDTVLYTLAGIEGPEGWGRRDDTFAFNDELARYGVDNRFRIGDRDLALIVTRTARLAAGESLSKITADLARALGVRATVLPATDDTLRTEVRLDSGWTSFQDYFVIRRNRDEVREVAYRGAEDARPAPGVIESIEAADLVVIGPSNPPLSVWPILAVPGVRDALASHQRVVAVSPLFQGKALKGPADRVMATLGLPQGNRGVARAYEGLIDILVVDAGDARDEIDGIRLVATDTRISDPEAAARFARELVGL
ncbi:MAG: 2-phospho-L-lactate transferase [Acidimicrobiales bacterium]|jgi:LPPG:FO 2-phospho-L-lactate transferase|nr:2-phospho-L-lactate transferase [Acidimicrobiales bacterium]